ncbi:MAG: GNAT family N-acetyltransferase [Patescibacteria group bacterium]
MNKIATHTHNQQISPVQIERAQTEDAEAIWPVYVEGRLDAQPNAEIGLTHDDMQQYLCGDRGEKVQAGINEWRGRIALPSDTHQVFVAREQEEGTVIGVAEGDVDRHGDRWLHKLYVAKDYREQGIGGKLIENVIDWHQNERVKLKVASYNKSAGELYKRYGFEVIRILDVTYSIYDIQIPQLLMAREASKS